MALSANDIYNLAKGAGFGDNSKTMVAIAWDESSFRADVVNSIGCVGLWQIHPVHFKEAIFVKNGWNTQTLKDPATNAKAAKAVFDMQGFKAWTTYKGGLSVKALSIAETSDVKGALPSDHSNDSPFKDVVPDIPGAINGFSATVSKVASSIGIIIVAVVLVILGVLLLSRNSIGKGAIGLVKP